MKILYSPVFIICCILFVAHQATQQFFRISIPLVDNHLDNLLAPPILFTLLVAERRIIFKRGADYTLDQTEVILATLFLIVVSEWLFPFLSDNFTSDWMDVLVYVMGGFLFYYTINKRHKPRKTKYEAGDHH